MTLTDKRAEWIQIELHHLLCEKRGYNEYDPSNPIPFYKDAYRNHFTPTDNDIRERYIATCPHARIWPRREIREAILLGASIGRFRELIPTRRGLPQYQLLFGPPEIRWLLKVRRLLLKYWDVYYPIKLDDYNQIETIKRMVRTLENHWYFTGEREIDRTRAIKRLFKTGEKIAVFRRYESVPTSYINLPLYSGLMDWWHPVPQWACTHFGIFKNALPKIFKHWDLSRREEETDG